MMKSKAHHQTCARYRRIAEASAAGSGARGRRHENNSSDHASHIISSASAVALSRVKRENGGRWTVCQRGSIMGVLGSEKCRL